MLGDLRPGSFEDGQALDEQDREFLKTTLAWLASFSRSLAYVQEAVSERLHESGELDPPAPGPHLRLVPPVRLTGKR